MEPNPDVNLPPEVPAPHQTPTLQPTREIPLQAQHPKYSVLHFGEIAPPGDRRRNKPNKFRAQTFQQFTGQALPVPDEVLQTWAAYESEWAANDIPPLVFDYGCLRLQVWKQSIPDPATHLEEVLKRMPFLATLPNLRIWFLRNVRGAQEVNHLESGGSRRCQLCGSNLLGIPLANHHHSVCLFRNLDRHTLMEFMAINHLAYCPFCGSRSATHTLHECMQRESTCRRCGALEHMEFQKLCEVSGVEPMTAEEQKIRVTQYRRDYFDNCRRLTERGELRYRLVSDATHTFYNRKIIEENLHPAGWGPFLDFHNEYPPIPRNRYQTTQLYTGLVTPETDAAWSNEYPVFPPSEMDEIEMLQWRVDEIRFGRQTRFNRTNPHPTYTITEYVGERARIREERRQAHRAHNEPIVPVIVDDWAVAMNEDQQQEAAAHVHPPLEEHIPEEIGQEDPDNREESNSEHSDESNAENREESNSENSDEANSEISEESNPENIHEPNSEDDTESVESSMSSDNSQRVQYHGSPSDEEELSDEEEPAVPPEVEEPAVPPAVEDPVAAPPALPEPVAAPPVMEPPLDDHGAEPLVADQLIEEPPAAVPHMIPQADIFHVEDSQGDDDRDADQERRFALTASRISSYRERTLEVLTSAEDLDLLASRRIPQGAQNLRDRIRWQIQTVTGRMMDEEIDHLFPQFILREYAAFLTGLLRTLAGIRRAQRVVRVQYTRCTATLERNDYGHVLLIPTLRLFAATPFEPRRDRLTRNWEMLREWLITDGMPNSGCTIAIR